MPNRFSWLFICFLVRSSTYHCQHLHLLCSSAHWLSCLDLSFTLIVSFFRSKQRVRRVLPSRLYFLWGAKQYSSLFLPSWYWPHLFQLEFNRLAPLAIALSPVPQSVAIFYPCTCEGRPPDLSAFHGTRCRGWCLPFAAYQSHGPDDCKHQRAPLLSRAKFAGQKCHRCSHSRKEPSDCCRCSQWRWKSARPAYCCGHPRSG